MVVPMRISTLRKSSKPISGAGEAEGSLVAVASMAAVFAPPGLATYGASKAALSHLGAGLRVLVLEFLPWRQWQKGLAGAAAALTIAVGLAFALSL